MEGDESVNATANKPSVPGTPPEASAPDKLLLTQRRLTIVVLALVAAFLVFQLAAFFADIMRILGISVLLSYLFINVVDFFERFLRSRALSILLVYAVLAVVTVVAVVLVAPAMMYQVSQLLQSIMDSLPDALHSLTRALAPFEARLQAAQINVRAGDIVNTIVANMPKPDPGAVINRVTDMAMGTMTWLLYGVSILVVSFYFLLEGHHLKDQVIALCPSRYRQALQRMAGDMDSSLESFLRGQTVLAILAGIVMLGVYVGLNVQYALLLSVFLAIWEIVPVIGPPIGFAPAVVAVAIHGMNFPGNRLVQILALIVIFNVMQQVKDNVVAPRYIGNVIGLHPILIFIAIMIGARLDGMLGVIFALPAACVLNVLARHLPLADTPQTPEGQSQTP
ncbi:MAG TPA: AI-2E family transporter [Candidatus Obscuribacterales bacterium]